MSHPAYDDEKTPMEARWEERDRLADEATRAQIAANVAHARANNAIADRQPLAEAEHAAVLRDVEGREVERARAQAHNARLPWVWAADLTLKASGVAALVAIALALWGGR